MCFVLRGDRSILPALAAAVCCAKVVAIVAPATTLAALAAPAAAATPAGPAPAPASAPAVQRLCASLPRNTLGLDELYRPQLLIQAKPQVCGSSISACPKSDAGASHLSPPSRGPSDVFCPPELNAMPAPACAPPRPPPRPPARPPFRPFIEAGGSACLTQWAASACGSGMAGGETCQAQRRVGAGTRPVTCVRAHLAL